MIRSRREFRCTICDNKYYRWQGICKGCGKANTLKEYVLIPTKIKAQASPTQKSLQRRSKNSERSSSKRMQAADGPDPNFAKIASSTGRVGHITGLRFDAVSKHYVIENKNRALPLWIIAAWVLINQRADDFSKEVLLHLDPPNMPRTYILNGVSKKLDTMAVITQTRHEELIIKERELEELQWSLKNPQK